MSAPIESGPDDVIDLTRMNSADRNAMIEELLDQRVDLDEFCNSRKLSSD